MIHFLKNITIKLKTKEVTNINFEYLIGNFGIEEHLTAIQTNNLFYCNPINFNMPVGKNKTLKLELRNNRNSNSVDF